MDDRLAIALDFGGTKVESALVEASGAVVDGSRHRAHTGRGATERDLELAVREVLAPVLARPPGSRIRGIGIGTAGPIDRTRGVVSPLNLPAWRDYPLRDFVDSLVHEAGHSYPVYPESDDVAITVAEKWVGAARGENNIMGMVISTGIGGGRCNTTAGCRRNWQRRPHWPCRGRRHGGPAHVRSSLRTGSHRLRPAHRRLGTGARAPIRRRRGTRRPLCARPPRGGRGGHPLGSRGRPSDPERDRAPGFGCGHHRGGFSRVTPDFVPLIRRQIASHYFEFVRKMRVVPAGLSDAGPLIGAELGPGAWLLVAPGTPEGGPAAAPLLLSETCWLRITVESGVELGL